MSSKPPKFELGAMLKGDQGVGVATAALVATDDQSRRYLLSARDAFSSAAEDVVRSVAYQSVIGRSPVIDAAKPGAPLFNAITAIELLSETFVIWSDFATLAHLAPPAAMDGLLDCPVRIQTRAGISDGTVTKTYASARFQRPEHTGDIYYTEGIEVSFSRNEPFQKGDAGSLITRNDGAAVGILLAGRPESALVAPIAPFLLARRLSLLQPTSVAQSIRRRHISSLVDRAEAVWADEPDIAADAA